MAALHRVVGMFGYYRNFIKNFSRIARPLNDLKKASGKYAPGARIVWTDECETAFKELKSRLSSTPILAHPKYDRPFILHTDASKDGFGAVLSQIWTADDYQVTRTRTPDTGLDKAPGVAFDRTRKPDTGQDMTSFTTVAENSDQWMHAYQCDPAFSSIYRSLKAGTSKDIGFSLNMDGLPLFRTTQGDRICLPANKLRETLHTAHDVLGHFGRAKTHARVMDTFYRPGLATAVAEYVRHCPECSVNKLHNNRMVGELRRIDAERVPEAYKAVNIDFIVNLPKSGPYDAIIVVVDRFTKAGTFIP